jgi:hypothetical protein
MLHLYQYYIDGKPGYMVRGNIDKAYADAILIAIRNNKKFEYINRIGWLSFFFHLPIQLIFKK